MFSFLSDLTRKAFQKARQFIPFLQSDPMAAIQRLDSQVLDPFFSLLELHVRSGSVVFLRHDEHGRQRKNLVFV